MFLLLIKLTCVLKCLYFYFCSKFQILTGVGYAVCISCIVNAMTDLAVISWSGHAIFQLFNGQAFPENFFFGKVLVCIFSSMYVTDVTDRACACLKSVLCIGVDKDHRTSNWVLFLYQICTTIEMNCKQELNMFYFLF